MIMSPKQPPPCPHLPTPTMDMDPGQRPRVWPRLPIRYSWLPNWLVITLYVSSENGHSRKVSCCSSSHYLLVTHSTVYRSFVSFAAQNARDTTLVPELANLKNCSIALTDPSKDTSWYFDSGLSNRFVSKVPNYFLYGRRSSVRTERCLRSKSRGLFPLRSRPRHGNGDAS